MRCGLRLRRLILLRFFLSAMVSHHAANRGTRHRMVTRYMADNAADGSTLDAAMRTCDDRQPSQRQGSHQ